MDLMEESESKANISIPKDLSSEVANKYLLDACERFNVKCPPHTTTRSVLQLVGHFLEESCINPTFIINQPEIMSLLAKWHRSKPGLIERFELFVNRRVEVLLFPAMKPQENTSLNGALLMPHCELPHGEGE
ncbi:hypothetical protein Q3G72_012582 [Acer saccharum]|nr:hypothetical protein Q3G72_012582 [Acer saccharum]